MRMDTGKNRPLTTVSGLPVIAPEKPMIEIVIPSLYLMAGIMAYAMFQHFSAALDPPVDRTQMIFGLMCLVSIPFFIFHAQMLQSTDLKGFVQALRFNVASILLYVIFWLWFIAFYTGKKPLAFLWVLSLLFAIMFIADLMLPFTIQYEQIDGIRLLKLPWGETVARGVGHVGIWLYPTIAGIAMLFGFSLFTLTGKYRASRSSADLCMLLAGGLFVLVAALGVLARLSMINFIEPGPIGVLAVTLVMSVSLTKDTRNRLRASEQSFRSLFNNSPTAMVAIDPDNGKIVQANQKALSMIGYSEEEILTKTVADVTCPEDLEEAQQRFEELAKGLVDSMHYERRYLRKDGSSFLTDNSVSTLKDSRGKVMSLIASGTDITERKRIENALLESETRFRAIIEQSPVGISLSRDGYTTDVNSAYLKMFGYNDAAEVRGTPVINRIAPQCRAEMEERIKQRSRGNLAESTYETIGLRKDGSQFPLFISAQRLMLKDGSTSSAFLIDFTDRKMAEAEHLVAMAAAAANRAKSEFLAGMSHELRTPLNAILGFGQLLEMDPQISSPEQRESVSHILGAGQQLLELINDLLDFAQIDIGKLRLNLQSLPMAELAADCVAQIRSAMAQQQHKHVLIENILTDPALRVQGDNQRVRQVLINLLSNAVKYNKDNGRVTVSGKITPEGRLRIAVSDTGLGIAADKLPLLFTPFERIDQKHGLISGVGIGLAITRQLLEAMHGSIGVESVHDQGSTFWFELPLAQEAHEATADSQKTNRPFPGGDARFVVLYIEDNPVNLRLVQAALKDRPGVELFTTETAETGLTFAAEDHPDLILIDIWLPGMDGITATTLLKKNDATKDIPVVALSAAAQQKDIDRALDAGCSDYLTKPIDLQALYQMIDKFRSVK